MKSTSNVSRALLEANAIGQGSKVAIHYQNQKITYNCLEENVNRFGNLLGELGVEPKDRIIIVAPDCPEFVYAFLGSIKYGAWPVPVSTMLKETDYEFILRDSEARLLVSSKSASTGQETKGLENRLYVDDFKGVLKDFSEELEAYPSSENDIAFWLYSSGSTGSPKGVPHRHRDILFAADNYGKSVLGMSKNDITFSASKLFFAYGLGNSISLPLRHGASTILLPDKPKAEKIFEAIARFRPTIFFGVPTLYNSMLKRIDGNMSFDSLRLCVSAGEALPSSIYYRWKESTGIELLDGIGSTEALHIFISNRSDDVKPGSTGRLVSGYQARIVDDYGIDVPDGEIGYLLIKGGSLADSYWKRPNLTEKTMLKGGWLRTGDMFRLEDGYFMYQGRGDDMLKVGGIWVSPMKVEDVLLEQPEVKECAVVGYEVEDLVKPFAFVVLDSSFLKEESEKLADNLLHHVRNRLPKHMCPWKIHFLEELPKTSTGKIQRYRLRRLCQTLFPKTEGSKSKVLRRE